MSWSVGTYAGMKSPMPTMLPACMPYFLRKSSGIGVVSGESAELARKRNELVARVFRSALHGVAPCDNVEREPSVAMS